MKLRITGFLFLFLSLAGVVHAQTQNSVEGDRQALVDLYNATDGNNWKDNSGWLEGNPSNSWYGVEVDANGRVIRLDLFGNNLSGSLPSSIGNLTEVVYLNTKQNFLWGQIPESLGNLQNCVWLQLAGRKDPKDLHTDIANHPGYGSSPDSNTFTGYIPSSIFDIKTLEYLDISGQDFTGTQIPSNLGNASSLKILALNYNNLTGPIPSSIGQLDLRQFYLSWNNLTGNLPPEMGNLTNLYWAMLRDNNFTGNIPSEWIGMQSLDNLTLQANSLSGDLPHFLFDGSMSSLRHANFAWNDFTGTLPEFASDADFRVLTFDGNELSGEIPESITNNGAIIQIGLSHNNFSGTPPSFKNFGRIRFINLNNNAFTGPLPEFDTTNENLNTLRFDNNQFSGSINVELAEAGNLPKIGTGDFDISGNAFTESDMQPLIDALKADGNLNVLDYSGQNPSDGGDTPPPGIPSLSSPADEATGVSTSPTLDWQVVSGADTYRVQLASSSDFSTASVVADNSGLTGTQFEASALDNAVNYFWRVQAANSAGTGSWSAARSFTTQADTGSGGTTIPAPVQLSPGDGAGEVPVATVFEWEAVSGADYYILHVSANDPSEMVIEAEVSGTSYTPASDLDPDRGHSWRVRAVENGTQGEWSPIWNFTTDGSDGGDTTGPPSAPTLVSPADGAAGVSTGPTLDWDAANGADTYRVQVAASSDFSDPVVDQDGLIQSRQEISGLAGSTSYFWRVRASNENGSSNWTASYSFTTVEEMPAVPLLVSPGNGATSVSMDPTLEWEQAEGADTYRLLVSADETFSEVVMDSTGISSSTSIQMNGLDNSSIYWWKVIAENSGGTGESEAWNFTTVDPTLNQPQLVNPTDGATGLPTTLNLSWNTVDGAESYRVQVSEDDAFQSPISDQSGVTATDFTAENLGTGATYYWRVRAFNTNGSSSWSVVWSFTTEAEEVVDSPNLISPSEGSGNTSLSPTFEWEPVEEADYYIFQASYSDQMVVDAEVNGTSYIPENKLEPETTHSWRVRAVKGGVEGEWSSEWTFTTETADEMETSLDQNYPNPFNPSTQIRFTLGETQQVSLKVYDTVGRVVATIVEGTLTAGSYERTFQADNLASGVYFLRFITENRILTSQMTLMK